MAVPVCHWTRGMASS